MAVHVDTTGSPAVAGGNWYARPPEQVAADLGVDPAVGLSAARAAELLAANGPNALPEEKPKPGWLRFLAEYRSYMQIILVAAAVVSLLIKEWSTGVLLPPLPNFLFQRDPSCWIFDGVTINPMTKPARKPETLIMETIYRFSPMFAAEKFPVWLGGSEEDWGRCHVEGGNVQPIGNGTVMIGMGERTTPQAVLWIARSLFRAGSARQVLAVHLPKSRSYMHLDTVITR